MRHRAPPIGQGHARPVASVTSQCGLPPAVTATLRSRVLCAPAANAREPGFPRTLGRR